MQIEEEKKEVVPHLPSALQMRSFAERVWQESNDQRNKDQFSFGNVRQYDIRGDDDHRQAASSQVADNNQSQEESKNVGMNAMRQERQSSEDNRPSSSSMREH